MAYNTPTQSSGNDKSERNIRYLDRDFSSFKNSLINFSKTYFPDTYTDFSPNSPGMMFMEMASYVGDVLSFYQDNQIQETFTQYARQTPNLYQLAYMMGYKPNVTGAAVADVEIFQTVDAVSFEPNFGNAVTIPSNTVIQSSIDGKSSFILDDFIDFSISSSTDPTEVTVFSVNGSGEPTRYLLKKTRSAISATTASIVFSFGEFEKFPTVTIQDENIIKIINCTDKNSGNNWYEVPYLGQDSVFEPSSPASAGDPYILNLRRTGNRFATRFLAKDQLQIQFGSGDSTLSDTALVPSPHNVGKGNTNDRATTAFSPANFTFTNTYGTAPVNNVLIFTYLKGGGISSNASANTLTNIDTGGVTGGDADAKNSIACNNPKAATGGSSGDSPDQLRENSLRMFGTQLRSVTADDYTVRALSMPGIYGSVGKIYVESQKIANSQRMGKPSTLDMYVLGFNSNNQLVTADNALKDNLKTYLSQYKMVGNTVSIKDGFIINIAVDFSIVLRPNYAGNKVLNDCLNAVKDYFNIDKWQINQPILLSDISTLLDRIEGVQTVKSVQIRNKSGEAAGYSKYSYDVIGATQNGTVFPSQDPCIFEVKYPDSDIRGSITTF